MPASVSFDFGYHVGYFIGSHPWTWLLGVILLAVAAIAIGTTDRR